MGYVYICITIDWEGEKLDDLNDLLKVRDKLDENIPFSHFICPNYFLLNHNKKHTADSIKSAIKPIDEVGLHIHCYKELINYVSDIEFKTEGNYHNTPSWFEKNIVQRIFQKYQPHISGRGVPLSIYEESEIEKIILKSKELLSENLNVDSINGFRAGGWIANDVILDVLERLDFNYDSSAVAPSILSQGFNITEAGSKRDDYGDKNGLFTEHLLKLWGYEIQSDGFLKNEKIRSATRNKAIQIDTQPFKYNGITEIPNNCGLTDFCSPHKTVIPLIKRYLKDIKEDPSKNFVVVYGCHQEGDAYYKNLLLEFISELNKLNTDSIKFIKMEEVLELSFFLNKQQ